MLPPFTLDREHRSLGIPLTLSSGRSVPVNVSSSSNHHLGVRLDSGATLSAREKAEVSALLKSVLRADEDLGEFYLEARRHPRYRWIPKRGAGRLLRSQSAFEDTVKMICTTNCSWALTTAMVRNLCDRLGERSENGVAAFPAPEAIADSSEKFLRKEIRAGYRAPYLLEFARASVRGTIEPEQWRTSNMPTEELFAEVRSVKGVGPYAAGNILKLLGRYDYLGIDSWCRKKFFEIHNEIRGKKDRHIEKYYEQFGRWRGLFFWLDVTKEWHADGFPG